jgi:hypothetical protein
MGQQLIQLKGCVGKRFLLQNERLFRCGVDGEKIRSHPKYKRTRENMVEFQQAMKAVKTFRKAFGLVE